MTDDIVLRGAEAGDHEAIVALTPRLADFGPPPGRSGAEIAEGEERTLRAAFTAMPDGSALLVASDAARAVLGFVFLETKHDYFTLRPHGHIGILSVAKSVEGRGVGRRLLEAADGWARGLGYDRLTLSVFAGNTRARAVYTRAGYQEDILTYRKELAAHPPDGG